MIITIYIFNFKKNKNKRKETKEEKRISVENLTGYKFALGAFLTYLIE